MYRVELIRPSYAERFHCIGADCEDTCCQGWKIPVDDDAYRKYESLPVGSLRAAIHSVLERTPAAEPGSPSYAVLKLPASGFCPMFNEARLCQIRAELGPDYLCRVCHDYPRVPRRIDDLDEQPLSLSCPEAARLVLLSESLLAPSGRPGYATWDDSNPGFEPLHNYFWAIRDFTIRLIVRRDYPLWQRLFLLGTFSRRLDAIARAESERSVLHFMREFSAALDLGKLNAAMESIRPDLETQLEMVLRMVSLNKKRDVAPRLADLLTAFASGIGLSRDARHADLIARYQSSFQNVYKPFFDHHPHMLENYLVNQIFGCLFPFGLKLTDPAAIPDCAEAFAALVLQFAMLKGMLIGVAGFYREGFSADHVVATVQLLSRHFEHNPRFLADATTLLDERKMNNAAGLTTLLRN
jgi:lysine-N-methylase